MQELSGETGITLAYAGKSRVAALRLTLHRDHPRVCGEKNGENGLTFHQMGSPPRMRGKGGEAPTPDPLNGITPAYAGKSFQPFLYLFDVWDHPRVCGEKFLGTKTWTTRQGSPPRMRGKD